ncbi:MAG: CheR family methyltransferase [Planctomycetota bacterium]
MNTAPLRQDANAFRELIAERLGLHFDDDKQSWLNELLAERVAALSLSGPDEYFARWSMGSDFGLAESPRLAEALTVGETFFFRYSDQFRALVEAVLPTLLADRPAAKPLQLLSAGCATGEEPYTLAILLLRHLPAPGRRGAIQALDLNPRSLARAERARYSAYALRQTDQDTIAEFFTPVGKEFQLADSARELVTFHAGNLVTPAPDLYRPGRFDVIFCRNVLMYFTPAAMQTAVAHLAQALAPGGFLFLGHAETLRGLSHEFHLIGSHDTFYYRRKLPGEASSEPLQSSRLERPSRGNGDGAAVPGAASTPSGSGLGGAWVAAIEQATERIKSLRPGSALAPSVVAPQLSSAPNASNASNASNSSNSSIAPAAPNASVASQGPAFPTAIQPRAQPQRRSPGRPLGQAMDLVREERFTEALALLHGGPNAPPADPDTQLLVAALLILAGRRTEGEEACRRLLAHDEMNAGAHYLTALCREDGGDTAGAVRHHQTAVYLDSTFAMPQLRLGLIARRQGDRAGAARALAQAQLLLAREDAARLLLFGGGFGREALIEMCAGELRTLGGIA